MSKPFMYWADDYSMPCWATPHVSDGALYIVANTVPSPGALIYVTRRPVVRTIGHDIMATPATWAALGARNLAHAYRPEVLP